MILTYSNVNPTLKPEKYDKANFDIGFFSCHKKVIHNTDNFETNVNKLITNKKSYGNVKTEFYNKDFGPCEYYHNGYIHYLLAAYEQDVGIEVGPHYFWNVIIHQLSAYNLASGNAAGCNLIDLIQDNKKINISFLQDEIDILQYVNAVKKLIPDEETYNMFFPQWSNELNKPYYNESMHGLFADMVKEYDGCYILGCSIPAIKVLGNQEDWTLLKNSVDKLNDVFNLEYIKQVKLYIDKLEHSWFEKDTWLNFFKVKYCGSGSQEGLIGDIRNLLIYKDELLLSDLPNMISKFAYINEDNFPYTECFFCSGIVGSNIKVIDNQTFLIPEYDYAITYKNESVLDLIEENIVDINEFMINFYKLKRLHALSLNKHHGNNIDMEDFKSNICNIWFQDTIIQNKKIGFIDNFVLNYNNYQLYKKYAFKYYDFLLDDTQFSRFINTFKFIENNLKYCQVDISEYIVGTLDFEIYNKYYKILNENDKLLFLKFIALNCNFAIGFKKYNLKFHPFYRFDESMNEYFRNEFKKYFYKDFENILRQDYTYYLNNLKGIEYNARHLTVFRHNILKEYPATSLPARVQSSVV